ncbi:potassium channel family protein [soil metagenome]
MKTRMIKGRRRLGDPAIGHGHFRPRLGRLLVALVTLALLHAAAMVVLEGLAPLDALWLTMSTMTTVGYGDLAAEPPPGRLATMLLVFLGGIWVAFQTAATYFDYRADRRERMRTGRWRWSMTGHILILNLPARDAADYVARLVGEFRASRRFAQTPIQVVCRCFEDGLPDALSESDVVHHVGDAWDGAVLRAAEAGEAAAIVVMAARETDAVSDAITLDIVDRLRGLGVSGTILAECIDDANRPRLRRFGADAVVRPLRGYPEMIVRALAAPGTEEILEDLFTSSKDECWRYDVRVSGWVWCDLVALLVRADIGLPIAYRRTNGEGMAVNPRPHETIEADKLFVLVREGNDRPDEEIAALLAPRP